MPAWQAKTVWITGASSGIGRKLAIRLAERGCTVIISARRESSLEEVAQQSPQKIIPIPMDVTKDNKRDEYRKLIQERVEALDLVILAAGVVDYENDLSFNMSAYQRVFSVNFFGLVNSVAIALPLLRKSKRKPHLVALTSLAMMVGFPRAEMYGSSKAAADYFMKSLRADIPPSEMDISLVRPGFVKTPMTCVNDFPMPFIMNVDKACSRIMDGIEKRTFIINFPHRFSAILKLASFFSGLWHKTVAPSLSRQEKNKEQKTLKKL